MSLLSPTLRIITSRHRFGGLILLVALATAPRPARADIAFQIVTPDQYGIYAGATLSDQFTLLTDNPAHAVTDNVTVSLNNLGSTLRFSADITGQANNNYLATTGSLTDGDLNVIAIPIKIIGTAGEADGTPISLALSSLYTIPPPGDFVVTQTINGVSYPVNATSTITGLKVGDTFNFQGSLEADFVHADANADLGITLTASPGGVAAAPEPGVLALIAASLPLAGLCRFQRRRN